MITHARVVVVVVVLVAVWWQAVAAAALMRMWIDGDVCVRVCVAGVEAAKRRTKTKQKINKISFNQNGARGERCWKNVSDDDKLVRMFVCVCLLNRVCCLNKAKILPKLLMIIYWELWLTWCGRWKVRKLKLNTVVLFISLFYFIFYKCF